MLIIAFFLSPTMYFKQNQCDENYDVAFVKEASVKDLLQAISPFLTMFSTAT